MSPRVKRALRQRAVRLGWRIYEPRRGRPCLAEREWRWQTIPLRWPQVQRLIANEEMRRLT